MSVILNGLLSEQVTPFTLVGETLGDALGEELGLELGLELGEVRGLELGLGPALGDVVFFSFFPLDDDEDDFTPFFVFLHKRPPWQPPPIVGDLVLVAGTIPFNLS